MPTIKLYDENAYLSEFLATIIECQEENGAYKILLDQTAFFPEAGGQKADTGVIGGAEVLDVQIENKNIYHYATSPLNVGELVKCKINFSERYKKMQIHTGEHIVSGVMHSLYSLSNVGFHLGSDEVTLDFDAVLTREQLDKAEELANEIIYKNVPVICYYPDANELNSIDYRSKKELDGEVRIVEIDGYDKCACCAPHVKFTGEVGVIKLTHFEKNKDGTRITLLCAKDALHDYREKYRNVSEISALLCAKADSTADAVRALLNEKSELSATITNLKRTIYELKAEAIETSDEAFISFEDNLTIPDIRNLANKLLSKRPSVFIFSLTHENEYNFVCGGNNMKEWMQLFTEHLGGKGGGSDRMIQGSLSATRREIQDFISPYIDKK